MIHPLRALRCRASYARVVLALSALLGCLSDGPASDFEDPNQINPGTLYALSLGYYCFDWYGVAGRIYWVQKSTDLVNWEYVYWQPGYGGGLLYEFLPEDPEVFLRVRYNKVPRPDPYLIGWEDDIDGDGLTDGEEINIYGTDPFDTDSNDNGIPDGAEILLGADPLLADNDDDGLSGPLEVAIGTNPLLADTDGDGVDDGQDWNPLDATVFDVPPALPGDSLPPEITLYTPADAVVSP